MQAARSDGARPRSVSNPWLRTSGSAETAERSQSDSHSRRSDDPWTVVGSLCALAGADVRQPSPESVEPGGGTQPLEAHAANDSSHVPLRRPPGEQNGGLVRGREHGNAAHTIAANRAQQTGIAELNTGATALSRGRRATAAPGGHARQPPRVVHPRRAVPHGHAVQAGRSTSGWWRGRAP